MGNNIFPLRAGEVLRAYVLKRSEDVSMSSSLATIVVERDAHKGMVIGEGGERLKRIGSEARQELEPLLDARVFLELWVKVREGWTEDGQFMTSLGLGS
jgi:GTP-binding protein Era